MSDQTSEIELQDDGPDLPVAKVTEQFPAAKGTEAGRAEEVAARSADGHQGTRFVKVFTVDRLGVDKNDAMHEANKALVLQEAIQRGLHPRGEVRFDGAKDHVPEVEPGRRSFASAELTYSVDTVPASVDHAPSETTTPRDAAENTDTAAAPKRLTTRQKR